jgi:hypothetical protein
MTMAIGVYKRAERPKRPRARQQKARREAHYDRRQAEQRVDDENAEPRQRKR